MAMVTQGRIPSLKTDGEPGNMKDAHLLNADYITIHFKRAEQK